MSDSRFEITWLDKWILKRIMRKSVRQSCYHKSNIVTIHMILLSCMRREFSEDNNPTLEYFARECYDDAIKAEQLSSQADNLRRRAY